jgi:hypothetical protein
VINLFPVEIFPAALGRHGGKPVKARGQAGRIGHARTQKPPVLIEVTGTMALVLPSRMLPPRQYVRFSIVAAVFGAACSPSIEPITIARECPNKPYRQPAQYPLPDLDQLLSNFENKNSDLQIGRALV